MSQKKLIVCSDGTWQKIDVTYPTNVAKIKSAIEATNNPNQIVFYDPGVGTRNILSKLFGGMFGWGLKKNIIECYSFLCKNFEQGCGMYLFGFSRGAYTVRSLAGLLYKCGMLKNCSKKHIKKAMKLYRDPTIHPDDPAAVTFREKYSRTVPETDNRPLITFLGCWDTVGALGVPDLTPRLKLDKRINRKYKFHDTKLSNIIQHARHAVAIDERRKVFNVTPMTKAKISSKRKTDLKQLWFVGDHGCVGGGDEAKEPLADIALHWMYVELLELKNDKSLEIDIIQLPDKASLRYLSSFNNSVSKLFKAAGEIDRTIPGTFKELDWSVKARLKMDTKYNPQLRETFQRSLYQWEMERVISSLSYS